MRARGGMIFGVLAILVILIIIAAAIRPSWAFSVTRTSDATPAQIWAWYANTNDVPKWDPLMKGVVLHGNFASGSWGENIPVAGPTLPFTLTSVTPTQYYTEVMQLPLASVESTHILSPMGGKTRIEHGMTMSGSMAWAYELLLRKRIEAGMNQAIDNLAANANHGLPK
jgi:hypothetical protein